MKRLDDCDVHLPNIITTADLIDHASHSIRHLRTMRYVTLGCSVAALQNQHSGISASFSPMSVARNAG